MKTLNRPMFNMGGPIKQGIMHGIREPYRGGGRAALVGNPAFPKDKTGRAHHVAWFAALPWLARAAPMAWRGFKAGRALAPGNLGTWGRIKSMLGPSARFRQPVTPKGYNLGYRGMKVPKHGRGSTYEAAPLSWKESIRSPEIWGKAIRENPITSLTALTLPATAADLTRKHGADVAKGAWNLTKRYGDMIVPGDQSHWWKDKEPPTGVPLNPNLQKKIAAQKELSNEKKKEFALQQREDRVQKYLEMMGYDRAKKTAIADALIDASKIVSDRGTLDPKNITGELINPIIQATSKRLDKPDQIREAVGLMATKAEIEKDLEDPSIKALRLEQLKELRGGFAKDMGDFVLSARGAKVKPRALERVARARAQEHGLDFTVVTDADIAGVGADASLETIIQTAVKDDGVYMIGDAIVQVTDGVPKQIA